jgi:hypothetical protein
MSSCSVWVTLKSLFHVEPRFRAAVCNGVATVLLATMAF